MPSQEHLKVPLQNRDNAKHIKRNMTTRKRNEFLEAEVSDEESEQGYDSGLEESKGRILAGRSRKRLKTDDDAEQDSSDEVEESGREDPQNERLGSHVKRAQEDESAGAVQDEEDVTATEQLRDAKPSKPTLKLLSRKQLLASQEAARKSGVIYLSRVPPFMKPSTLKSLLTPYGSINRVFLTPEDPALHKKRVRSGGNKKRSFTDGWVEFLDKKAAKIVTETLNARIVGGKKGGWYHDDVWNIKYLKGFKWHHLTEQIRNENAERSARMRSEIARQTRENKEFLRNVERGKMVAGMESKKKTKKEKREQKEDGDGTDGGGDVGGAIEHGGLEKAHSTAHTARDEKTRRQFRQTTVMDQASKDKSKAAQPEEVRRVLSKIL